ncbi:hypothetical protein, partial [Acinetobacter baumannii]|uniref:hypothetical protein n=1 Tax=Acinetobacter baumannii TaxID=470 RepID=UPI001BB461C9
SSRDQIRRADGRGDIGRKQMRRGTPAPGRTGRPERQRASGTRKAIACLHPLSVGCAVRQCAS